MLLATIDGAIQAPTTTGQRGTCPGCGLRVDSAVGELVIAHWRHHGDRDCDSWASSETDWHLDWKVRSLAHRWSIEVPFGPPLHRADAVGPRGHVIEFQHSGMTRDTMLERSAFYGADRPLVWVLDAEGTSWRRRWQKWRYDGTDIQALLVLDDGQWLQALDPIDGQVRRFARHELFDKRLLAMATWIYWQGVPCHTCGTTPSHAFPDGSGAYRCSHPPVAA